jgi:hypothetical protein
VFRLASIGSMSHFYPRDHIHREKRELVFSTSFIACISLVRGWWNPRDVGYTVSLCIDPTGQET